MTGVNNFEKMAKAELTKMKTRKLAAQCLGELILAIIKVPKMGSKNCETLRMGKATSPKIKVPAGLYGMSNRAVALRLSCE